MPVYQEKDKSKWTKDGRNWYFLCYYSDIYGKRKQKESKKFATKKEATLAEMEFLNNIQNYQIDCKQMTFVELYNAWWKVKKKKLKITNAKNLKPSLDKNILSFFEKFKLDKISIPIIDKYLQFLEEKQLSINYVNSMISYCYECLEYASVYYNFDLKIAKQLTKFRDDSPEKMQDSEYNFWTLDEFEYFISFVDNDYYKLIFIFLYKTGLRIGEFLALKWSDMDLTKKTIRISKELARGIIIKPKTKNSIRNVDLDNDLIKLLNDYDKQHKNMYGFNNNWYLFGGVIPTSNTTLRRKFNKYIKLAKVKHITLHGFRHSHVSLLINLGCDSRDVAERIGDTVQTVERTYYHMFPEKKKQTIDRLNNLAR